MPPLVPVFPSQNIKRTDYGITCCRFYATGLQPGLKNTNTKTTCPILNKLYTFRH